MVDLPIMVVGLPFFHELLAEFADEIKALADESKLEFSEIVELFRHNLPVLEVESEWIHVQKGKISPLSESGDFLIKCDFGL